MLQCLIIFTWWFFNMDHSCQIVTAWIVSSVGCVVTSKLEAGADAVLAMPVTTPADFSADTLAHVIRVM